MKLSGAVTILGLAAQAVALAIGGKQMHVERESDGLQSIVGFTIHNTLKNVLKPNRSLMMNIP
jgi:hypothetical protein